MAGLRREDGDNPGNQLNTRSGTPPPPNPGPAPRGEAAVSVDDAPANVTPEEQTQYEQFVDNGYSLIYDPKMLPQVLERLRSEDPTEGLASTAALVVMALEDSAQQQGIELADGVKLHGGTEILEDLANLAREAGIHDYGEDEIEAALYQALDLDRGVRQEQGRLEQDRYAQELEQLMAADQRGELEQMMPGVKEHYARAGGGQPAPGGGEQPRRGLMRG